MPEVPRGAHRERIEWEATERERARAEERHTWERREHEARLNVLDAQGRRDYALIDLAKALEAYVRTKTRL